MVPPLGREDMVGACIHEKIGKIINETLKLSSIKTLVRGSVGHGQMSVSDSIIIESFLAILNHDQVIMLCTDGVPVGSPKMISMPHHISSNLLRQP